MPRFLVNKKGFTIVEILIMVFLIGMLGTIAVSSYLNSTATFRFLSEYKQLRSSLDVARTYAITNRQVRGEVPDRYGVCVSADSVVVFADVGDLPMQFDPDGDFEKGACKRVAEDPLEGDEVDVVVSSHVFGEDYSVGAFEVAGDSDLFSDDEDFVLIFYESDGTVTVIHDDRPISTANAEFFLRFYEEDGDRFERNIKIYLLTGLADEI